MQKDIEKIAYQILKEHPEENVVYVAEDKQAFFNKLASKNHATQRGIKVFPFYRAGAKQELEAVETVEEMQDVLEERQAVISAIEKVVEKADHQVEVSVDTDPVLAGVINLRNQLGNDLNKLGNELIKANAEKETLSAKLKEMEANYKALQKELDAKNTKK